ncbi:MAG: ZIP family metal transporter [Clostridia bacterium]|nr:ZIP family metal transporter [Clostridia bacterium]
MDWSFIFLVTAIGLLAGVVGTGMGGILIRFLPTPRGNWLAVILGFSAGIMMAIVFLELVDEALELAGIAYTIIGLTVGVLGFLLLDKHLPHNHIVSVENSDKSFLKKGTLLGIGIGLHNLPEGLAIGAGYAASTELGLSLALLIALHNIPEGLAIAAPLKVGKMPWPRIMLVTAGAGFPMAIGAFLGGLIGNISPAFLAASLGFAGGAMLYIVADELIPDAYQEAEDEHSAILGILMGVILGILLIYLLP